MKSFLATLATLLVFGSQAYSQTVTFAEHIAPIIYSHCTQCHRAGEIGPFPLTNYGEVMARGSMIEYVTSIRYMPPWKAEVSYQQYQKVNTLTDQEIQLISDWVAQGYPEGDSAPPAPVFPTGSRIGVPDLAISFAEGHAIDGNNTDEYRFFVIPTGLTEDRDLIALEMRPSNTSLVHHALFWEDTTGQAAIEDANTPQYGYAGGTQQVLASGSIDKQLPTHLPGQKPTILSNGMAYRLHAGSDILVQIHYAPSPVATSDSTTLNLFFAPTPATRNIQSHVMIPFLGTLTNGPFIIPANQTKEFHGQWTVPEDASFVSIMPHMHQLGTHWTVYAVTPSGDTINLVKINSWDFNWQSNFDFKYPLHLPQGTVVHGYAGYDNTVNNISNPNNPPQLITWGENTSDEMYWLSLQWVSYQAGDENLNLEPEPTGIENPNFFSVKDKLYPLYPNPASDILKAGFTLSNAGRISLKLFNMNGQVEYAIANDHYYMPGFHITDVNVSKLAAGVYTLVLEKGSERSRRKFWWLSNPETKAMPI